jgi:uncharacterized tellurite resistance protein B-like protein
MIQLLKKLFTEPEGDGARSADDTRRLAAAALLIEVARADFTQDANEEHAMALVLRESLGLSETDLEALLHAASEEVDHATSLYDFTRLVNNHYSMDEKRELIAAMWRVAYADAELDKYEEHLIRRVAELIYVPHEDFIRGKEEVKAKLGL